MWQKGQPFESSMCQGGPQTLQCKSMANKYWCDTYLTAFCSRVWHMQCCLVPCKEQCLLLNLMLVYSIVTRLKFKYSFIIIAANVLLLWRGKRDIFIENSRKSSMFHVVRRIWALYASNVTNSIYEFFFKKKAPWGCLIHISSRSNVGLEQ